ncbi:hypothetical protein [Microtetraspora glauca]|uniref:Uncharacterized protein n=1 Tax=Microtetraspora glauca TaxID=1996 RepID=A0ABV3GA56_MICGL
MYLLTAPYVTPAEFEASPTWLDTQNLVPNGDQLAQDSELANVLLRASSWADGCINQPLGAHVRTESARVNLQGGRLSFHAADRPVRRVTALSYGADPGSLTPVGDLSGLWIEDDVQILTSLAVVSGWGGVLEFGPRAGRDTEVFVRISYVAGHTCTVLTAAASSGTTSVTVADPTGIYPGDVLRFWDPSREEAVTVAPGYVPGTATVPLAGSTTNAHGAGAGISNLPADARQAVILRACSMLLRGETAGQGDYPEAAYGPTAARSEGKSRGSELLAEAKHLLRPYRRVR